MARLDEELTLYHPDGAWNFLEERLARIQSEALEALVFCPKEDIDKHRERLKLARHLANLPEQLMEQRAQLMEQIDGSGQPV